MCRLYLFTVLHTINFTVALSHSKSIFVILHREVSSYLFIAPTHTLTSTSCSQLLCMIIFFRSRLDYTWIDSCRRSFSCVFYFRLEVRCFFLRKPVGLWCLFFLFFFKISPSEFILSLVSLFIHNYVRLHVCECLRDLWGDLCFFLAFHRYISKDCPIKRWRFCERPTVACF